MSMVRGTLRSCLAGGRATSIRAVLLAVLLVCSGVAACSGSDPQPSPSHSVPVATPTPSITVTKPALQLGRPTEDSAIAFVKYFIAAYNYAYATYDTSLLEEISQPTCKFCAGVVDDVQRLEAARIRVGGSEVKIADAFLPRDEPKANSALVITVSSQRPGTATSPTGQTRKVDGARNTQLDFGLDWDGGKWLVRGVDIHDKGTPWPA